MAKGDIVLITFPFTNLNGTKLRPAVVLAETELDFTLLYNIPTGLAGAY